MKTVELNSEYESEMKRVGAQERLSALHDGQLNAEQAAVLVRQSLDDESIMQQWRSMSAISNVLREQQHGVAPNRLAAPTARSSNAAIQRVAAARPEAANDGVFRWKMVAGFAVFAAVGSLAWGLLGGGSLGDKSFSSSSVLAQSQTQNQNAPSAAFSSVTVAGQEAMMIRDPRLDELLAAHKQFGGTSALQQPVGSLRSVSLSSVSLGNARP